MYFNLRVKATAGILIGGLHASTKVVEKGPEIKLVAAQLISAFQQMTGLESNWSTFFCMYFVNVIAQCTLTAFAWIDEYVHNDFFQLLYVHQTNGNDSHLAHVNYFV